MLTDIRALAYLELRQLINRLRMLVRRPGRALVYVFALGYFIFISILRARFHHAPKLPQIAEPYASAIFFAYLVLLGVIAYGAASGIAGAFSSPADALFLTRSKIPERIVVLWLQLRRCATTMLRMLFTIVIYTLMFAASGTVSGIGLAIVGGSVVAAAQAVPVLKLRAVAGARTAQSLAGTIAAIGLLPLLIVLSGLIATNGARFADGVERLGMGGAVNALFGGNLVALGALYAFAALLVALSLVTGTGLIADLYAASMQALTYRERAKRSGGAVFAMEHAYHTRRGGALQTVFGGVRGPWTIAWKESIAFTRSPSMQRLFLLGFAVCAVAGFVFGNVAAASRDSLEESIAFAATSANLVIMFVAMGSAIGLAADLRKPLWWMGPDPLWLRLVAWMAGTSWRLAVCLTAGIVAWAAAMRVPAIALAGIPIALAGVIQLRAVGLLLYALFPSTIDQRGPLALVRALLTYLLALPPAVAGIAALLLLRSAPAGVACAVAVSAAETALLVALAAARISGRGVALAQAEAL
ncbi:MAG TPA: putative ABC exporter domain-containing protein [Candidatus Baltobacteraceae bacterium]|nr:putative ABC exporter domain-containing protein [Candidatus Baltobacteraceae bacterium]